jgi:hypothetical protein
MSKIIDALGLITVIWIGWILWFYIIFWGYPVIEQLKQVERIYEFWNRTAVPLHT